MSSRSATREPRTGSTSPTRSWGTGRSTSSSCRATCRTSTPGGGVVGAPRPPAGLLLVARTPFDKRGVGLSDRPPHVDVENWMEDTCAVLNVVGLERAAVPRVTAGGLIAILFVFVLPGAHLVAGALRRVRSTAARSDQLPDGLLREDVEAHVEYTQARWGTRCRTPALLPQRRQRPRRSRAVRQVSASLGESRRRQRVPPDAGQIDVRHVLRSSACRP